jgi:hypothetical protein
MAAELVILQVASGNSGSIGAIWDVVVAKRR